MLTFCKRQNFGEQRCLILNLNLRRRCIMKNNKKGFTLIELLVVVAIIGLLSTLAIVALNSARAKARDSKRVADIKQLITALELHFADQNAYPVAATALTLGDADNKALCSNGWNTGAGACTGTTYMGLVPSAPTPPDGDCDANNNPYRYTSADGKSYTIDFCIGAQTGDLAADEYQAVPNGIQPKP